MFTHAMRWSYVVYTWLILGAVIVQFFLAGLGVFGGGNNFEAHRNLGYALLFLMALDLVLAIVARLPWRIVGLTLLLPLLVVLQSVFIQLWESGQSTLAAFHVVNALLIFSLCGYLALRSRSFISVQRSKSVTTRSSAR